MQNQIFKFIYVRNFTKIDKFRFLVFFQLRNIPLRRILPPVLVDLGPKNPLTDDISPQQMQKNFLKNIISISSTHYRKNLF